MIGKDFMINVEDYVVLRKKLAANETRFVIGFGFGLFGFVLALAGSILMLRSVLGEASMNNSYMVMFFVGMGLLLIGTGIIVKQSKPGQAITLESKKFYSSITEKYGFTLAPGEKINLGDPVDFKDGEPVQVLSAFKEDKNLTSIAIFVEDNELAFYSTNGEKLSLLVGDTEKR